MSEFTKIRFRLIVKNFSLTYLFLSVGLFVLFYKNYIGKEIFLGNGLCTKLQEDGSFVRNIITKIDRIVIWLKIKTDFEGFLAKNKMIFKTFQTNNIYLAYIRVFTQNICLE